MAVILIILKVILWILLAVLGIIVLACVLPVSAKLSYIGGKLAYKASYSFVPLMDSQGGGLLNYLRKRRKKPKKDSKADKKDKDDSDGVEIEEVPELSEHPDISAEQPQESENVTEEITEPADDIPETAESGDTFDDDGDFTDFDDDEQDNYNDDNKKSLGDKIEFLVNIWEIADRPLLKIFKGIHFNDIYIDFIVANQDAYKCALSYGAVSGTVYNFLAWLGALCTIEFKTVDINAGFGLDECRWDISAKIKFRLGTLVIAGIWFLMTYLFKIFIPNKINAKKKAAETAE